MLKRLRSFIRSGVEDGTFLYDSKTGQRLSGVHHSLTPTKLMFSLLAGAVAALITVLTVISRYTLKRATYHFNKMTQTAMRMDIDQERFIRRTVHRIPHFTGNNGGGHGGGGGGGGGGGRGASVHRSSGGMVHGGGGRHF